MQQWQQDDSDGAISKNDDIDFDVTVTSSEFENFLPFCKQKMPALRCLQKPNLLSKVHLSSSEFNLKKKRKINESFEKVINQNDCADSRIYLLADLKDEIQADERHSILNPLNDSQRQDFHCMLAQEG
jgi:hypothetical protein